MLCYRSRLLHVASGWLRRIAGGWLLHIPRGWLLHVGRGRLHIDRRRGDVNRAWVVVRVAVVGCWVVSGATKGNSNPDPDSHSSLSRRPPQD